MCPPPRGSLAQLSPIHTPLAWLSLAYSLLPVPWGHGCRAPLPWGNELHRTPAPPHGSSCSPQKYVQDILQEHLAEPVYRALKEQGGHIYVCGDVTMAADVLKAIQRIMTQQGKLSAEDAGVFISRLRVSDRPASWTPFLASSSRLLFLTPPVSVIGGALMTSPAAPFSHVWLKVEDTGGPRP